MSYPERSGAQLEFFGALPAARRRPSSPGLRSVSLRQDHLVLMVILGLIAGSVVFSFGVERGKRLARLERPLLEPAPQASKPAEQPKASPLPATPAPKAPAKSAPARSRFAVRVVTYSQPKLAQQELQRLQQRGESAFLLNRSGRLALCVGPFSTRENASAKLSSLRKRYRDCFIQDL